MLLLKVEETKDLVILISDLLFQIFLKIFWGRYFYCGGRRSGRRASNRGNDLRYDVSISLEEAYAGVKQKNQLHNLQKML